MSSSFGHIELDLAPDASKRVALYLIEQEIDLHFRNLKVETTVGATLW